MRMKKQKKIYYALFFLQWKFALRPPLFMNYEYSLRNKKAIKARKNTTTVPKKCLPKMKMCMHVETHVIMFTGCCWCWRLCRWTIERERERNKKDMAKCRRNNTTWKIRRNAWQPNEVSDSNRCVEK